MEKIATILLLSDTDSNETHTLQTTAHHCTPLQTTQTTQPHSDDQSYLMADFRELCYTTKWFGFIFIALLVIIFYCFFLPIYIFYTLFKIRTKLEEITVQHKFGFLYQQFNLETYWWESASILRKLLLASVPVFMHEHSMLQLTVSIVISIFFHLMHSHSHPFKLHTANVLQHLTFAGTWMTFFLLLLQASFRDKNFEEAAENIAAMCIGFNVMVLVGAFVIIGVTIRNEVVHLKNSVEVDLTISKSLSSSIKSKMSKFSKMSKAHVKAKHLEIEAEKARHAADLHGGRNKTWSKLSLLTKLGGLAKHGKRNPGHTVGYHQAQEDAEAHHDRLNREAATHLRERRKSMAMASAVGREKIMERLKLRAKAKKGKVMDKVDMFKCLTTKAKTSLIMAMVQGDYKENDPLCKQGEEADKLFVLLQGTARCMVMFDGVGEQEVHRFKPLDVFGESAGMCQTVVGVVVLFGEC